MTLSARSTLLLVVSLVGGVLSFLPIGRRCGLPGGSELLREKLLLPLLRRLRRRRL